MSEVIELENIDKGLFKDLKVVSAIGFFDGIHLGHTKIIKLCVARALKIRGVSVIFTFDKPPMNIITGRLYKKLIISYVDKYRLMERLGVDYILVAKFNSKFANMHPSVFCNDILLDVVNIKELFLGEDFRFGKDAKGDVEYIKEFFKGRDVVVNKVPILEINGVSVSSTVIRGFYKNGDIDNIITFLGRVPSVKGKVVSGDNIGKGLGFPTANIIVFEKYVIPRNGVYFGYVNLIDGSENLKRLKAVVNIGMKPTFNGKNKMIESHILDFNEDIYNRKIEVFFLKRVRNEINFNTREELIKQIKDDIKKARIYFKNGLSTKIDKIIN